MAEPKRLKISQGASQCSFTTATAPNQTLASASGSAPTPTTTQIAEPPETPTPTLTPASIPASIAKQCNRYWTVDIIDDQGVTRGGRLKVHEVWSLLTRQRVVVPFSAQGQAIGEAAGLLGVYLGIVGTDLTTFPISYHAWCQIPHSYKETCFDSIKAKFCLYHNNEKHFVLRKLGQNWRNYRAYLFQKYYDVTKSRVENLSNHPNFIPRDMWAAFVDYQLNPKTQEMIRKNCQNRKQEIDALQQEISRLRSELLSSNQLLESELKRLKDQQEQMRVAVIYIFQNLLGNVPPEFAHLLNP